MKNIGSLIIEIIKNFISAIILLIIVMLPVIFVIPAWVVSLFGGNATSLLNVLGPDIALILLVLITGLVTLVALIFSQKLIGEE